MKKTLVLGLAIITGGVAQAEISISMDTTFASSYVFRGIELGDHTLHPSIEVSEEDWYAGIWMAFPINNRSSAGWGDEFDFYAGYTPTVGENVELDLGVTHYYYPSADSTTEVYAGVNLTVGQFTPGLYLYYDVDLEVFTAQANVGFSIPMDNLGTSLDLAVFLGSANPDDGESYSYYGIDATVPFKISENATINVGAHYAHNSLDFGDSNHFWGTIGLTLGF